MTSYHTFEVVGDWVDARQRGSSVDLSVGDNRVASTLICKSEPAAARLAAAIQFARSGPEHSVYTITSALGAARELARAVAAEAGLNPEYHREKVELDGREFDLAVLAHNLGAAAGAAYSAVAQMDRALAEIAGMNASEEAALPRCKAIATEARRAARGPDRDGQFNFLGDADELATSSKDPGRAA